MLGQYAQVMAIKAAQQEMEGSEDVRRYFSAPADQRGDISQIMHTKGGRAASETLSQNAQRQLKMEIDALGAAKENVYMAKDPAALAEYIKGVYSSPAGKLLSTFVPVDKALAAIPTDPVAFKEYQKNFGLTADQIVSNATKERGQNMTYGASIRGQNMTDARMREQQVFEQNKPIGTVTGEDGYLYNKMSDGSIRLAKIGGMPVPATGTTAPAGGGSEAGGTVTGTAGSNGVNALAPAPVNSLVSPTAGQPFKPQGTQFAPQFADIQNPLNPSQTIKGVYDSATKSYIPIEVQRPGMTVGGSEPDSFNVAVPSSTAVGYRRTADGKGLEFIPGGPADPEVQAKQTTVKLSKRDLANREAKYPQATAALKGFEAKTTKFVRDIDELITNEKGLNEITGFLAGRTDLSALSSEGRRALALFNTITAKGGFSELQDMRNSSPTGGALGNVSDREGRQLIDAVGALSRTQNAKDLRTSLGILKTDVLGANERLNDAYNLTYEYKNKDRVPTLPPGFVAD
jgi:hypothetical protein